MSTEEIVKGNKLIAEFMGTTPKNWNPSHERRDYDNNWNYLMPVVEKIENSMKWKYSCETVNNLYKNEYGCIIRDAGNATYIEVTGPSKIECVFKAVTEFISYIYPKHKSVNQSSPLPS